LRTGKTIAWVEFEDALQEIFVVQVLPNDGRMTSPCRCAP
jgi:hypothetical protein